MVRICIFNYQPIMLRLGDHVLLSYYETHLLFCFLYYYFQYVWRISLLIPFSWFHLPSFFCCRSNGIVYKEQMSAWATAHTSFFSLCEEEKQKNKRAISIYFIFLCTRHGMEEEAGSKGSSSHKRCNNFRWPTRKTRKRKISVIFLGC